MHSTSRKKTKRAQRTFQPRRNILRTPKNTKANPTSGHLKNREGFSNHDRQVRVDKIKDLETLGSTISELSTRLSQWIKIIRTPNRPLDTSNFTNREHQTNESRTSNKRNLWHTPRRNTRINSNRRDSPSVRRQKQISRNSGLDYLGTLDSIILELSTRLSQ